MKWHWTPEEIHFLYARLRRVGALLCKAQGSEAAEFDDDPDFWFDEWGDFTVYYRWEPEYGHSKDLRVKVPVSLLNMSNEELKQRFGEF